MATKRIRNNTKQASTVIEQADTPQDITEQETPIGTSQAEEVQEEPQLSRKEIISQMWNNAKDALQKLADDRAGLEQLLDDKVHQKRLLIQQRDAADSAHQEALDAEGEAAGRVVREQSRLKLARGTQGESEHESILQSLIADLDQAKSRVEETLKARDEAYERAKLISALDTAIEEIEAQMADLDLQARDMEDLKTEQFRLYGVACAEEIAAEVIATRDAYEENQRQAPLLAEAHSAAVQRINDLAKNYPDLHRQLLDSHGHALQSKPEPLPGERCLEALRTYILTILEYGPHARHRIFESRHLFAEYLALDFGTVQEMMKGTLRTKDTYDAWGRKSGSIPYHPRLDLIDKLIRDERLNRHSYY